MFMKEVIIVLLQKEFLLKYDPLAYRNLKYIKQYCSRSLVIKNVLDRNVFDTKLLPEKV